MFIKNLPSNISKYGSEQLCFRGFCQKFPHMQSLKVRTELGHNSKPLSYNFGHKNNIVIIEQPKKILNLTFDPR